MCPMQFGDVSHVIMPFHDTLLFTCYNSCNSYYKNKKKMTMSLVWKSETFYNIPYSIGLMVSDQVPVMVL